MKLYAVTIARFGRAHHIHYASREVAMINTGLRGYIATQVDIQGKPAAIVAKLLREPDWPREWVYTILPGQNGRPGYAEVKAALGGEQ